MISKASSPQMFDKIASRYDLINGFISLGQHHYWRRQMLRELSQNIEGQVLDLATGTADVAIAIAQSHPKLGVVGADLSSEMLAIGRQKVDRKGLGGRVELRLGDAMGLDCPNNAFAAVTMSFGIRNVVDPLGCLQEIFRVLEPGGTVVILESGQASGLIAKVSGFYLNGFVPWIGGVLSGKRSAYGYLSQTMSQFPSGRAFLDLMTQAGFSMCKARPFAFGHVQLYCGVKP